jgi:hypothetical protein
MRLITRIVGLVFIGMLSLPVFAQIDINSLKNVDVDMLSDAQIKEFVSKLNSSGYSLSQVEKEATARGVSPSQFQKLRARMEQVKGGSSSGSKISATNQGRTSTKNAFGGKEDSTDTYLDQLF